MTSGGSITSLQARGERRWKRRSCGIAEWWRWRKDVWRMAANVAGRHYRTCYAMLLRLYPRPFRERFEEGMAQTFHDLCREHSNARRGLCVLALWIFFETSVGIVRENTTHMPQLGKTML